MNLSIHFTKKGTTLFLWVKVQHASFFTEQENPIQKIKKWMNPESRSIANWQPSRRVSRQLWHSLWKWFWRWWWAIQLYTLPPSLNFTLEWVWISDVEEGLEVLEIEFSLTLRKVDVGCSRRGLGKYGWFCEDATFRRGNREFASSNSLSLFVSVPLLLCPLTSVFIKRWVSLVWWCIRWAPVVEVETEPDLVELMLLFGEVVWWDLPSATSASLTPKLPTTKTKISWGKSSWNKRVVLFSTPLCFCMFFPLPSTGNK